MARASKDSATSFSTTIARPLDLDCHPPAGTAHHSLCPQPRKPGFDCLKSREESGIVLCVSASCDLSVSSSHDIATSFGFQLNERAAGMKRPTFLPNA